uniref:Uncharacterized protein n=1 Tax=Anguilla anguilla TaxID=7936 RepID=A0A0E9PJ05_ANGAN
MAMSIKTCTSPKAQILPPALHCTLPSVSHQSSQ